MGQFPRDRAKILELAQKIGIGMSDPNHVSAFTASPVSATEISEAIDATTVTAATRHLAQLALNDAIAADQNAVTELALLMQQVIGYARGKKNSQPKILKWIDVETAPHNKLPPGSCRGFKEVSRTSDTLFLSWKGPKFGTNISDGEGGRARIYEVVWRENAASEWHVAATVLENKAQIALALLGDSKAISITVRAVNKQGTGPISPPITLSL